VALNPLCDLAGYALAPASVIAPVTGMDIVAASMRERENKFHEVSFFLFLLPIFSDLTK